MGTRRDFQIALLLAFAALPAGMAVSIAIEYFPYLKEHLGLSFLVSALVTLALFAWAAGLAIRGEREAEREGAKNRIIPLIGMIIFGLALSAAWYFWPRNKVNNTEAPLEIDATIDGVDYPNGTEVHGLKWDESYSGARLFITNQSDRSYSELEIYIRTNLLIRDIVFSNSNRVSRVWTPVHIAGLAIIDPKTGKNAAHSKPFGTGFKINCDKLIDHETLEIIVAIVGERPAEKPQWLSATADYIAFGRSEHGRLKPAFVG
jgi:hypothetical protein